MLHEKRWLIRRPTSFGWPSFVIWFVGLTPGGLASYSPPMWLPAQMRRRRGRVEKPALAQVIETLITVGGSLMLMTAVAANGEPESISRDRICTHNGAPFVGACRTVRADLVAGGDSISVRVQPKGSKRILGYADGALRCDLPRGFEKLLEQQHVVEADVTIRPVTRSEPGVMQFVCIASVKNVRTKR